LEFQGVEVKGAANFNRLKVHSECRFNGWWADDEQSLAVTSFGSTIALNGADIAGTLYFYYVECKGKAEFVDAKIGIAMFTDPNGVGHAKFEHAIDLRGMTYSRILADWKTLLSKTTPYDRQAYVEMERFYRSLGDDQQASRVYLARRRRESADLRAKFKRRDNESMIEWVRACVRLLPDLALDSFPRYAVRYGVRPFRLVVMSVLFLLMGSYVFSQPGAVVDKDAAAGAAVVQLNGAEALRYSLSLFVPGISLSLSRDLIPASRYEAYATIHQIAGLMLLPLSFAVLVGLFIPKDRLD
jgi:hypothetical protein